MNAFDLAFDGRLATGQLQRAKPGCTARFTDPQPVNLPGHSVTYAD